MTIVASKTLTLAEFLELPESELPTLAYRQSVGFLPRN